MTATAELDLKQRLARLSTRDRREVNAYLLRLKHEAITGRREISRVMRAMDSGSKTPLSELADKIGNG